MWAGTEWLLFHHAGYITDININQSMQHTTSGRSKTASFEKTGFPNKDFLILERSIFHEINCSLFSAKILLLLLNCLFQSSNIPALTHFQFSFNARKHSLWSLRRICFPDNKSIWIKLGEEMPFILCAGVSPGPSQKVIFIFFSDAGLPAMTPSLTLYLASDTSINKTDNAS